MRDNKFNYNLPDDNPHQPIDKEDLLIWLDELKETVPTHVGIILDIQRYIRNMPIYKEPTIEDVVPNVSEIIDLQNKRERQFKIFRYICLFISAFLGCLVGILIVKFLIL